MTTPDINDWRVRHQAYLRHLRYEAPPEALRVSLAEALHDLSAILRDLHEAGDAVWDRHEPRRAADHIWLHRSLADIFLLADPSAEAHELDGLVGEIALLVAGIPGSGPIRLWLDDDLVDRAAPVGWVHVTTAWEATALLGTGRVVELSLDHDLGGDDENGTGMSVVNWLDEAARGRGADLWPREGVQLHSANPSGVEAMSRAIEAAAGVGVRRSMTRTGHRRFTFGDPAVSEET